MDHPVKNAPAWLRLLLPAVLVALLLWGYWYFTGSVPIGGVIGGLVGAIGGMIIFDRRRRQAYNQVERLPKEKYDEALRAARKGSAPTDPEIRNAAIRLVTYDLEQLERRRVLVAIVVAMLLVVAVTAAVLVSTVLWVTVPMAALVGAYFLAQPALLRRRLAHLENENVQA